MRGGRLVLLTVAGLVAAVAALWWTTGRGGLEVDGPVVSHSSGWGGSSAMDAVVGGTLAWDGRCLLLSGDAVVWPGGTEWDDEREVLVLPDGSEATPGDDVRGGGGMALEGPEDADQLDSEAARLTADCRGDAALVVFDTDADLEVVAP